MVTVPSETGTVTVDSATQAHGTTSWAGPTRCRRVAAGCGPGGRANRGGPTDWHEELAGPPDVGPQVVGLDDLEVGPDRRQGHRGPLERVHAHPQPARGRRRRPRPSPSARRRARRRRRALASIDRRPRSGSARTPAPPGRTRPRRRRGPRAARTGSASSGARRSRSTRNVRQSARSMSQATRYQRRPDGHQPVRLDVARDARSPSRGACTRTGAAPRPGTAWAMTASAVGIDASARRRTRPARWTQPAHRPGRRSRGGIIRITFASARTDISSMPADRAAGRRPQPDRDRDRLLVLDQERRQRRARLELVAAGRRRRR